jgi:hypothetical protein
MIDKDRVIIVTQPSKVGINSREPRINRLRRGKKTTPQQQANMTLIDLLSIAD